VNELRAERVQVEIQRGWRRIRPVALISQWWLGNEQSLGRSKRPFRATGSGQEELAGGLRSVEPSFYKRSDGEQRRLRPVILAAKLMPCMPAGVELFVESLGTISFLARPQIPPHHASGTNIFTARNDTQAIAAAAGNMAIEPAMPVADRQAQQSRKYDGKGGGFLDAQAPARFQSRQPPQPDDCELDEAYRARHRRSEGEGGPFHRP